jgi:hypothetical protein
MDKHNIIKNSIFSEKAETIPGHLEIISDNKIKYYNVVVFNNLIHCAF